MPQLGEDDEVAVVDNASATARLSSPAAAGRRARDRDGREPRLRGRLPRRRRRDASAAAAVPEPRLRGPRTAASSGCATAATEHPDWDAWQAAVLLHDGHINTDGGVVHYLGIGWAGDCGDRSHRCLPTDREIAFPSGAAMVVRRRPGRSSGASIASYFMYAEDLDLGPSPVARRTARRARAGCARDPQLRVRQGLRQVVLAGAQPLAHGAVGLPAALLALLAPGAARGRAGPAGGGRARRLAAREAARPGALHLRASRRRSRAGARCRRPGGSSAREFATHLTASLDSPYLPIADDRWLSTAPGALLALVSRMLALLGALMRVGLDLLYLIPARLAGARRTRASSSPRCSSCEPELERARS